MSNGEVRLAGGIGARLSEFRTRYEAAQALGLKLDLTRGKPSPEQLNLSDAMLTMPGLGSGVTNSGVDTRNYGEPDGLVELRAIFAEIYGMPVENLLALSNGSLRLMHDVLVFAYLYGVPGSPLPWGREEIIRFICPVPGYDRHFAICEALGIEMIPVAMHDDGPDLAVIRDLVANDATIKGMWLVPTHSNPSGAITSPDIARALVEMPCAAPDFRIFWDDAYGVHHLVEGGPEPLPILAIAEQAGKPDRPLFFTSTSKITFAGSGVGFIGASDNNLLWLRRHLGVQSISPDKTNHLRHALFLNDPAGVREHMRRHREILVPKFKQVDEVLHRHLDDYPGVAHWNLPAGGYFISLNVVPGTAKRVVQLAGEAGVALTPAGATFPYGTDPDDSNIRIAPSMPSVADLAQAAEVLALSVLLAAAEQAVAA
ncbi:MAG: aminotransferase class I/II-fold pyridoxal phosphate-dependent enzyme [Promicromonosporaceae bacterium]|nr:aminotransferase class I/II-fold pyridoxal phosphate-dependent enzyme [Promicromonosporaceae bacterium]